MAMPMTGFFYKRLLPCPPAIDFASPEGKKLFTEALHNRTMEGFFKLISYFQTQSEPAYCGLASLSMVLNALSIDPCRKWKGPWRWFDESMLDCCEPLDKLKAKGISFGKVVCLAHCAGADVEAFRTNQISIDEFRKYVMVCSSSDDCHLIVAYHRGVLRQTGTGHFSPVGGYHVKRDMVLILDVARFKYPPHWVLLSVLWIAMDTVIEPTGLYREFMLMSRRKKPSVLLCTLSWKQENWISIAKYLIEDVPALLSSANVKGIGHILSKMFFYLPSDFEEFIKWVADFPTKDDGGKLLTEEENEKLAIKEEVLKLVRETRLYKHVKDSLSTKNFVCKIQQISGHHDNLSDVTAGVYPQRPISDKFLSPKTRVRCYRSTSSGSCDYPSIHPASSDVLTPLLLALPHQIWSSIINKHVLQEILGLVSRDSLPPLLQEEIMHLKHQLFLIKKCKDYSVEYDLDDYAI